MVKNLKLNVKNAQLAEALNLTTPKLKAPKKAVKPSSKEEATKPTAATPEAIEGEVRRSPLEGRIVESSSTTTPSKEPSEKAVASTPKSSEPSETKPRFSRERSEISTERTPTAPLPSERLGGLPNRNPASQGPRLGAPRPSDRFPADQKKIYPGFGTPQAAPPPQTFKASASTLRYASMQRAASEPARDIEEPSPAREESPRSSPRGDRSSESRGSRESGYRAPHREGSRSFSGPPGVGRSLRDDQQREFQQREFQQREGSPRSFTPRGEGHSGNRLERAPYDPNRPRSPRPDHARTGPRPPRPPGTQGDHRYGSPRPGGRPSGPGGGEGQRTFTSRNFGRAVSPGQRPGMGPRPPGMGTGRPMGGSGGGMRNTPILPGKEGPVRGGQSADRAREVRRAEAPKDREGRREKTRADARNFDARDRQGLRSSDDEGWRKRRAIKGRQAAIELRPESEVTVRPPISVKDLAAVMKLKVAQLIAKLFMQGMTFTANDLLDDDTVIQLIGAEFGCTIHIDRSEAERVAVTSKSIEEEISSSPTEELLLRAPVVAFMGHVDHGKTSLIDAIRRSNRVAQEAGAITQHIGAFQVQTKFGGITILDTPGHEAFSTMRERGAEVTDVVVLVIAGDEGIRQQTLEALAQAKAANVQIIVALNKADRPNFDAENVYRQLSEQDLLPEAWGGTTICVPTSAVTKQGIDHLLEMIALQTEVMELRANPAQRARGTVLESEMHKGFGATATILVQNGTLRVGDSLVFDDCWARVKTMRNDLGENLKEAGPSTPVKITGLSELPEAGSGFVVVANEREAREISAARVEGVRSKAQQQKRPSMETLLENVVQVKTLRLIIKADVKGSLEAALNALSRIKSDKVSLEVVASGVGEVTESDVILAATSKAIIVGFHTAIEAHAASLIRERGVVVQLHDIIYHLVDAVKDLMRNLLDKVQKENELGVAEVRQLFKSSALGVIAGCQVIQGLVRRNCQIRVVRDGQMIWKGAIGSLKRLKEDVREVAKGFDCGILLSGFSDFKEGDLLQAYEYEYISQEL